MCVWILLILLKTENNKKNNKKVTVHAKSTVHCWGPFVEAQRVERPNDEGHKELTV